MALSATSKAHSAPAIYPGTVKSCSRAIIHILITQTIHFEIKITCQLTDTAWRLVGYQGVLSFFEIIGQVCVYIHQNVDVKRYLYKSVTDSSSRQYLGVCWSYKEIWVGQLW